MFDVDKNSTGDTSAYLAKIGYWPARAAQYLAEKKYSKAVALCNENLQNGQAPLSARFIYAKALYHAGQIDSAEQQLNHIVSVDSDYIAALKYLADIKFQKNDEYGAVALYEQILELDPLCSMLFSDVNKKKEQTTTTTITLKRKLETEEPVKKDLRKVLLYTETVGDLYLQQGFPLLAEEVFEHLYEKNTNPRFAEKLATARGKIKEKEQHHVKKTD